MFLFFLVILIIVAIFVITGIIKFCKPKENVKKGTIESKGKDKRFELNEDDLKMIENYKLKASKAFKYKSDLENYKFKFGMDQEILKYLGKIKNIEDIENLQKINKENKEMGNITENFWGNNNKYIEKEFEVSNSCWVGKIDFITKNTLIEIKAINEEKGNNSDIKIAQQKEHYGQAGVYLFLYKINKKDLKKIKIVGFSYDKKNRSVSHNLKEEKTLELYESKGKKIKEIEDKFLKGKKEILENKYIGHKIDPNKFRKVIAQFLYKESSNN